MSSKKKKMNWLFLLGLLLVIPSFPVYIFAFFDMLNGKGNQTTTTIIQNGNSVHISKSDMNWDVLINIMGATFSLIFGIIILVLYFLWKKDNIKIYDYEIKLVSLRKVRRIKINEVASCKSNNSSVILKLKNEATIKIMFIENAYDIAKYINEKLNRY